MVRRVVGREKNSKCTVFGVNFAQLFDGEADDNSAVGRILQLAIWVGGVVEHMVIEVVVVPASRTR